MDTNQIRVPVFAFSLLRRFISFTGRAWALLFACALLAVPSARADGLPVPVRAALQQAALPASSMGVWVQEVGRKKPVLAVGADMAMNPASVMKLLTTYAALEVLGPAYTWNTDVYGGGNLSGGALSGDLYLKGYGDPGLTLGNFWLLLRQLRQVGVRDIRGGLVLDQSYFEPGAYDAGAFDQEPLRAYNAGPAALLVNFNAIGVRLMPGADGKSVQASADPAPQNLNLFDRVEAVGGPCGDWRESIITDVLRSGDVVTLTLRGRFPVSCGDRIVNLNLFPRDVDYVGGLFRQLWGELGGQIGVSAKNGRVPADARPLVRIESAPLADVIRDINKYSNNVMARQVFLTLGAEQEGAPATPAKGAAAVKKWLAGKQLDFPELVLENGSGLSRSERISPHHLAQLLLSAYDSPVQAEFESSLPIAAIDGTMKKRLTGQAVAGHAHIKTGSLEGVRSLAGYVFDNKGRRVAVVAVVNHPRAGAARPALDALLEWVYQRR